MKKTLLTLAVFVGLATAACPYYPHKDFTWARDYVPPQRPPDSLLDNCPSLNLANPALCDVIQNDSFTADEKKQLILDDFIKNHSFPPYNEAFTWNNATTFTKYAPDGVIPKNGPYLKNAWIKITSLTPSVDDSQDNKTFVNDTGRLRVAHAFSFVVPKETFPSDCSTTYEICGYNYAIQAYDNDELLSSANQPYYDFQVSNRTNDAVNNFSAVLTANSEYLIHHYRIVTRCTEDFCYSFCELAFTEDRRDALQITDNKLTHYYGFFALAKTFVDSFKNGLLDAWLSIAYTPDLNFAQFNAGTAFLRLQKSQYRLQYALPPYNLLTPINSPVSKIEAGELSILSRKTNKTQGLYEEKIHFLTPSEALDCQIEINSHFTQQIQENACFFNESQQPFLILNVSKIDNTSFRVIATFYDNTTGLPFIGKKIDFEYGSQNDSVETDANGKAQTVFLIAQGVNVVSATFWTDFETKTTKANIIVPVPTPSFLSELWYYLAFILGVWLLYSFLKRRNS